MKNLRWYVAVVLCLSSLYSHAILIVDSTTNIPLETGNTGFSINMLEHGYNPATDIANSATLTMRFREIVDNGDDWDAGTTEFVVFYAMMWGYRELVYGDVSTETITFSTSWQPGQDTCVLWGMEECDYDPVKSGNFSIGIWNASDNLAMDEVLWEFDFTRTSVSEPSTFLLFVIGLFGFVVAQRKNFKNNLFLPQEK